MKRYTLRIEDQIYQAEIEDINARPIRVNIDGEVFEIIPEETTQTENTAAREPLPMPSSAPAGSRPAPVSAQMLKTVQAPIPGVIISVKAKVGDEVKVGQELCILEAMKMNNIIRASRTGKLATVFVSAGQSVKHHEALMEFED